MKLSTLLPLAAAVAASLASASAAPTLTVIAAPIQAPALSEQAATAIARDAYVYGVPMIDSYRTMYAFNVDKGNPQYKGPFNSILNIARAFTPDDTAFVAPNSDTPYSFAALDLRAEPMVITIPKMEKNRYFAFQLMDLFSFNFAYIGSRTTGNEGGHYMIAGPQWKNPTPKGITKVIRSETELVNVVGRTQLFDAADLDKVRAIQAGYQLQPLSAFLGQPAPAAAPAVNWIKPLPADQERSSPAFFSQLAFLLQFAEPPHPTERTLRWRFAQLGIVPGQPFDTAAQPAQRLEALQAGMVEGQKEIDRRRDSLGGKNDMLFGSRSFLKNDYVARATGAQVGIGANSRDEAQSPTYEKDAGGQQLDGRQHRYTLHFAKGQLPPVNAFWSVTMYDLPQQLLVKNPIDRYLINSPMLPSLKTDADGGLTVYIQADSPGQDKEANWLPAPKGPFMLAMRYYWPRAELLKNQWPAPQVQRAD
ncbi:DUF1254 domain-containing protein [Neisseriaceae bacterium JH1-16]|nr:DUF1254 domain-containing protein [Neisseriaceae bacterium JH1-16]